MRCWREPATGEPRWQVVVPKDIRGEVLEAHHGSPGVGHFGVTKTLKRLMQTFYWGQSRRDVEDYCRRCDSCTARKGPQCQSHLYSSAVLGHQWTRSMCWAHFPIPAEGTDTCWSPSTTLQSGQRYTPFLTKKQQPWPKPWCKECSVVLEHPQNSTQTHGGTSNHKYSRPCVASLLSERREPLHFTHKVTDLWSDSCGP